MPGPHHCANYTVQHVKLSFATVNMAPEAMFTSCVSCPRRIFGAFGVHQLPECQSTPENKTASSPAEDRNGKSMGKSLTRRYGGMSRRSGRVDNGRRGLIVHDG